MRPAIHIPEGALDAALKTYRAELDEGRSQRDAMRAALIAFIRAWL